MCLITTLEFHAELASVVVELTGIHVGTNTKRLLNRLQKSFCLKRLRFKYQLTEYVTMLDFLMGDCGFSQRHHSDLRPEIAIAQMLVERFQHGFNAWEVYRIGGVDSACPKTQTS